MSKIIFNLDLGYRCSNQLYDDENCCPFDQAVIFISLSVERPSDCSSAFAAFLSWINFAVLEEYKGVLSMVYKQARIIWILPTVIKVKIWKQAVNCIFTHVVVVVVVVVWCAGFICKPCQCWIHLWILPVYNVYPEMLSRHVLSVLICQCR